MTNGLELTICVLQLAIVVYLSTMVGRVGGCRTVTTLDETGHTSHPGLLVHHCFEGVTFCIDLEPMSR